MFVVFFDLDGKAPLNWTEKTGTCKLRRNERSD